MKRFVIGVIGAAMVLSMARTATAQAKTVNSDMRTETAVVEAIESGSRTVTLRKPDGTFVSTVAGPEIKRFEEIKIGDKVTARFYENVIVQVKPLGAPDVNTATKGVTPSDQVLPGGTKATQRTITATITAVDMNVPSIAFTGPNGWKYTSKVQDKSALAKVKVGDRVDIVWTEAVLVSVERGK